MNTIRFGKNNKYEVVLNNNNDNIIAVYKYENKRRYIFHIPINDFSNNYNNDENNDENNYADNSGNDDINDDINNGNNSENINGNNDNNYYKIIAIKLKSQLKFSDKNYEYYIINYNANGILTSISSISFKREDFKKHNVENIFNNMNSADDYKILSYNVKQVLILQNINIDYTEYINRLLELPQFSEINKLLKDKKLSLKCDYTSLLLEQYPYNDYMKNNGNSSFFNEFNNYPTLCLFNEDKNICVSTIQILLLKNDVSPSRTRRKTLKKIKSKFKTKRRTKTAELAPNRKAYTLYIDSSTLFKFRGNKYNKLLRLIVYLLAILLNEQVDFDIYITSMYSKVENKISGITLYKLFEESLGIPIKYLKQKHDFTKNNITNTLTNNNKKNIETYKSESSNSSINRIDMEIPIQVNKKQELLTLINTVITKQIK